MASSSSGKRPVPQPGLRWELWSVPLSGAPWALPSVLPLVLWSVPLSARPSVVLSVTPSGSQSVLQSDLPWEQ